MLTVLGLTLPLCLDVFALSIGVLGEMRLTRAQRIRISVFPSPRTLPTPKLSPAARMNAVAITESLKPLFRQASGTARLVFASSSSSARANCSVSSTSSTGGVSLLANPHLPEALAVATGVGAGTAEAVAVGAGDLIQWPVAGSTAP